MNWRHHPFPWWIPSDTKQLSLRTSGIKALWMPTIRPNSTCSSARYSITRCYHVTAKFWCSAMVNSIVGQHTLLYGNSKVTNLSQTYFLHTRKLPSLMWATKCSEISTVICGSKRCWNIKSWPSWVLSVQSPAKKINRSTLIFIM